MAVSAEIEGMFMQIGIEDEDQNALRFLWPTKMVPSNTKTRDISSLQNAHHPLPSLRFIKQLPITA